MSKRKCCCYGACLVFSDNFERTDDPELGSDWWETSGWEIDTGRAQEAGNAGAVAYALTATRTKEQYVDAEFYQLANGDKPRVLFNVVDDDNYWAFELHVGGGTGGADLLKWIKVTAGAESVVRSEDLVSGSTEPDTSISVCVDSLSATVEFSPTPTGEMYYHENPALHPAGKYAGVGNGGSTVIDIEDFSLYNFRGTDGDEPTEKRCCTQQCICEDDTGRYAIPHLLRGTLIATGGCYSAFHNVTMDLVYYGKDGDWQSYDSGTVFYDGSAPQDIGSEGAHPFCHDEYHWVVSCGEGSACGTTHSGANFAMTNNVTDPECADFDSCTGIDTGESSYDCSPFNIVFPGVSYDFGEGPYPADCCCDDEEAGSVYMIVDIP
jgi:hypothetical protein